MNLAHLHILLNHFPTIGTVIALSLFIAAFLTRSNDLKRASLVVYVSMALLVIPTYLSGTAAQRLIQDREGISMAAIDAHQNAAMLAFVGLSITGVFAWFGLWRYRRLGRISTFTVAAILVASSLTLIQMVRVGTLGGEISHPEIRSEQWLAADQGTSWAAAVQTFMTDVEGVWPICETLHFIGMVLLFGVALLANLRLLGMMKAISFVAVHRLLPVGVVGFIVNVATGMLFYLGNPERYMVLPIFSLKILFLVLAGFNVIYFTIFDEVWTVAPEEGAPLISKLIAASTLVLLVGVIYFGRMIPYFE
jgi:uncharacterized membrane protein